MREYLTAEGFRIVTAENGQIALFTARQEKPDLVLLDIMMPEMNSYDFIRTCRRESNIPILLSAKGVQDNGSGIAPELMLYIFERFRRGDPSRQDSGSGLRLAIVKAIVELQGRSVSAENNSSKATTIKSKFP